MATEETGTERIEVLYGHSIRREPPPSSIGPAAANTIAASSFERFLRGRSSWHSMRWNDLVDKADSAAGRTGHTYLLTLDDGYRDNLTDALPILERLDIPVLIFVTTGFVDGTNEPAEAVLARIVDGCARLRLPGGGSLVCASIHDKQTAYDTLKPILKKKNPAGRRRFLEQLAALNGIDFAPAASPFLTWEDVRRLDRHPLVTIGAHTLSHPLLTTLSPIEAYAEIRGCKAELERHLGHAIDCFAYPYGSHNILVRWLVAQAGFKLAFATGQRALPAGSRLNRLRIPRLDLKNLVAQTATVAVHAA